jgi:hypothetical protein
MLNPFQLFDRETPVIPITARAESADPDELPRLNQVILEDILGYRVIQDVELYLPVPLLDQRKTLRHSLSRATLPIGRHK